MIDKKCMRARLCLGFLLEAMFYFYVEQVNCANREK
jgi:hypothetical protein